MTTFQPVNVGLGPKDYSSEVTTPTTPRAPITAPLQPNLTPSTEVSAPSTPKRLSFVGLDGQRPLPNPSFNNSFSSQSLSPMRVEPRVLSRGSSHQSTQSTGSQGVEMDDSDDGEGNSEGESVDGETGRPSKKKKGQRFFCTEFAPCNLSFTRSEHLARHIRKHTGERPFQCHCSRRFSRLDNLRQHAQTVHVNEEIPGDSLAATGTRFQRQIRTDRVRTPGGRSRASTVNSQGSHGRGHSRNLSASSIGSTGSAVGRDEGRRRPQPLIMAGDPTARSRLTLDIMRAQASTPPAQYGHSRDSSDGISTPTSTTFSNGQQSPGYGSSLGSPVSNISRNSGLWDRTHGRRLSVPSGPNPFSSPQSQNYAPLYFSPLAPSNASNFSSNSSVYGSPTNSTYGLSRRESALQTEAEWRRRTWHPSTYSTYSRPATSGLSYSLTPDAPRPAFAPQAATAAGQPHRLPGIETFDQIHNRPPTSPHRVPSPMQIDTPNRPLIYPGTSEPATLGPNDRRGHASWDKSLHHNLTKLEISNGTPPKEAGLWGQQTIAEMQEAVARPSKSQAYPTSQTYPASQATPIIIHQESQKRPAENTHLQPTTPARNKRHGWYNGPVKVSHQATLQQRPSPEDSSSSEGVSTPCFSSAEYHPAIIHSNGYIESHYIDNGAVNHGYVAGHVQPSAYSIPAENGTLASAQHRAQKGGDMSGLEVLVAVATSEDKARAPLNH